MPEYQLRGFGTPKDNYSVQSIARLCISRYRHTVVRKRTAGIYEMHRSLLIEFLIGLSSFSNHITAQHRTIVHGVGQNSRTARLVPS